MMIPYSHVLDIPKIHPFDTQHRWTTFLGGFVKPIIEGQNFPYWFSYYDSHARFRVHTDDPSVLAAIQGRMAALGLAYRLEPNGDRMEKDLTLEDDLGNGRFLGAERVDLKPLDRALKVLNLVHAGAELFLHSLVRDFPYWREEICQNPNNTFDSSSRSYIHLLHNLTQSSVGVCLYHDQNGNPAIESEYGFSYIQPRPHPHSGFRVTL